MSQSRPENWQEASLLYSHLVSLGHYFPLNLWASSYQVREELEPFRDHWKPYNPQKPGFKRWGLSVTSLDGGFSGDPDLTSLFEVNEQRGTSYDEKSFRQLTSIYEKCPLVRSLVEPFLPFLGRAHFLKFDSGGFFPYHRDAYSIGGDTFRIFVPFVEGNSRDFIFLLGTERIQLEPGRAYFINTRMEHALFSFDDNSLHLVLNVDLSPESVQAVCRKVFSR